MNPWDAFTSKSLMLFSWLYDSPIAVWLCEPPTDHPPSGADLKKFGQRTAHLGTRRERPIRLARGDESLDQRAHSVA